VKESVGGVAAMDQAAFGTNVDFVAVVGAFEAPADGVVGLANPGHVYGLVAVLFRTIGPCVAGLFTDPTSVLWAGLGSRRSALVEVEFIGTAGDGGREL